LRQEMGMVAETEHTCQLYHRLASCQIIAHCFTNWVCEQCGRNDEDDHATAMALAAGNVHREFAGRVVNWLREPVAGFALQGT